MREIRPYGSVRGVRRKPYPYRDTTPADAEGSAVFEDAGPWLIFTAPRDAKLIWSLSERQSSPAATR